MRIDTFKHEFRKRAGVFVTNDIILFRRPLELYDFTNDTVIATFKGRDVEPALNYDLGDKTIRDIITRWKKMPIISLQGGNGSSSGMDAYTHRGIPMGGENGGGNGIDKPDLPARFNAQFGNETSFEKTLEAFRNMHVNDNYESGITVDAQGFVTGYVHGQSGSVGISAYNGEHVIHNHPAAGYPIFSGADLVSTALENSSGITASSTSEGRTEATAKYAGDYIFNKGKNFNAAAFVKAVKGAYLKGKDYNDAVDKWLKAHQQKYGYTYTYIPEKAKAAAKGKTKATGSKKVKPVPDPNVFGVQISFFDDDT